MINFCCIITHHYYGFSCHLLFLFLLSLFSFFFFNDTATTEIYTLSLHDALPISSPISGAGSSSPGSSSPRRPRETATATSSSSSPSRAGRSSPPRASPATTEPCGRSDRKSTRLNSSHSSISYAVFCLKKKKK